MAVLIRNVVGEPRCPNCLEWNPKDAEYCANCGFKLTDSDENTPGETPPTPLQAVSHEDKPDIALTAKSKISESDWETQVEENTENFFESLQWPTMTWLMKNDVTQRSILIVGAPECLDEATEIPCIADGKIKIATLQLLSSQNTLTTLSMDDGRLVPSISRIVNAGIKHVFAIELESGRVVCASEDHLHLLSDHSEKTTSKLRIGDRMIVWGIKNGAKRNDSESGGTGEDPYLSLVEETRNASACLGEEGATRVIHVARAASSTYLKDQRTRMDEESSDAGEGHECYPQPRLQLGEGERLVDDPRGEEKPLRTYLGQPNLEGEAPRSAQSSSLPTRVPSEASRCFETQSSVVACSEREIKVGSCASETIERKNQLVVVSAISATCVRRDETLLGEEQGQNNGGSYDWMDARGPRARQRKDDRVPASSSGATSERDSETESRNTVGKNDERALESDGSKLPIQLSPTVGRMYAFPRLSSWQAHNRSRWGLLASRSEQRGKAGLANAGTRLRTNTLSLQEHSPLGRKQETRNQVKNLGFFGDAIIRITRIGQRNTFDLITPIYHNFMLANGVVTHNSGKSSKVDELIHDPDPRRGIIARYGRKNVAVQKVQGEDLPQILEAEKWPRKRVQVLVAENCTDKTFQKKSVAGFFELRQKMQEKAGLSHGLVITIMTVHSFFKIPDEFRTIHIAALLFSDIPTAPEGTFHHSVFEKFIPNKADRIFLRKNAELRLLDRKRCGFASWTRWGEPAGSQERTGIIYLPAPPEAKKRRLGLHFSWKWPTRGGDGTGEKLFTPPVIGFTVLLLCIIGWQIIKANWIGVGVWSTVLGGAFALRLLVDRFRSGFEKRI